MVLKNRLVFDVWILKSTILTWNKREIKFKTQFTLHCPIWARGVPIGGCGGVWHPPIHQFCRQNLLLSANSREGGNEKGEERKEGKEKEKRKGKERKENERKKKGKREKGKERKEKEKREKEKKKLEKKERKRKEKMREDRKGVCHWQVKIVLSANVGLYLQVQASFGTVQ